MFLRFSKGGYSPDKKQHFRKCVMLGNVVVMEYGDNIVGAARLHEESDKCFDYDVVVAKRCELGADKIARFIKDMIGKSNKFAANPSAKRRKYYVDEVDCESLPVTAKITFSRL